MSETENELTPEKMRIDEAVKILIALGFPAMQQNERSALTLLALLGLKPSDKWSNASNPMIGITPMMDYFAKEYGKHYQPNSRETVRRQTVHQFREAGLILQNPDNPARPVNSGKTVYQISPLALALLRTYDSEDWENNLVKYLDSVGTLQAKYAQTRQMNRLPVTLPDGKEVTLSAGGQNVLIVKIIEDFCANFTPGGTVLYIGDADEKWAVFERGAFAELGLDFDLHGKMPDVVVHMKERNWLVLVEAVTSHGPVNAKRLDELKSLFKGSSAGLVFVTAFPDRKTMNKYLAEIAWETEVWVAEAAEHLIHFNGERFLGPYG